MRVNIQVGTNEIVMRGDANFISKMLYAVEVYEGKREEVELKPKTHNFKTTEQMREAMAKARAVKAEKAKAKKKIAKHRAPRYTTEEEQQLFQFVNDENNYRFMGNKVVINIKNLRKLAREMRRTTKALSLRICSEKRFRDARDHMIQKFKMARRTTDKSWFQ